jgi:hypothetical protein
LGKYINLNLTIKNKKKIRSKKWKKMKIVEGKWIKRKDIFLEPKRRVEEWEL